MRSCLTRLSATLVVLALAGPAAAQDRPIPRSAPDFLFEKPHASVTLRGSWLFTRGESDWYDFVTGLLTIDTKDFNAPGFGLDLNVPVTSRLEAQAAFDFSRSSTLSEYRDFVDNNRLPIQQTTSLRELNVGGNLRYLLMDRGQQVSRLVWVPRRIVPFVGAGAGAFNYKLQQIGDFVDFQDSSVFGDTFVSRGWSPSAQVFGGVDVRVFKRVYVTVDGRYLWAADDLGRDFIGFDPIDLAGFRLSGGVNFNF
jgi:hypothetical protein